MTVAELVKELKQHRQDLPVMLAWGERYAHSDDVSVSFADRSELYPGNRHGEIVLIEP